MLAKPEYFSPPDEACCWPGRRGGEAGRGAVAKLLLAGALMLMAGASLAEIQLAVRTAANGRARRSAEASGRGFRQASARLATACTAGKEIHEGRGVVRQVRRCKIGNRAYSWQGDARWVSGCLVTFVWVVRLGDTSCLLLPLGRRGFGAAVCLWRSSGRGGTLLL